jgi:hypothetical protein
VRYAKAEVGVFAIPFPTLAIVSSSSLNMPHRPQDGEEAVGTCYGVWCCCGELVVGVWCGSFVSPKSRVDCIAIADGSTAVRLCTVWEMSCCCSCSIVVGWVLWLGVVIAPQAKMNVLENSRS